MVDIVCVISILAAFASGCVVGSRFMRPVHRYEAIRDAKEAILIAVGKSRNWYFNEATDRQRLDDYNRHEVEIYWRGAKDAARVVIEKVEV